MIFKVKRELIERRRIKKEPTIYVTYVAFAAYKSRFKVKNLFIYL